MTNESLKARIDRVRGWHPSLPGYKNYQDETLSIIEALVERLEEAEDLLKEIISAI